MPEYNPSIVDVLPMTSAHTVETEDPPVMPWPCMRCGDNVDIDDGYGHPSAGIGHYCRYCYEAMVEEPGEEDDYYEGDEDSEATRFEESPDYSADHPVNEPVLLLPAIDGREPRLISFEQEVGRGGRRIAESLHMAGFTLHPTMLPYHNGHPGGFCHVEEDGSVNAEIIYSMLRLDDRDVARRAESALDVVRSAIQAGEVSLDMRCGFHVHVDVRGFAMRHIENLYHLWNHLEDTIYRLGSANWSSHRSLRTEENYAPETIKGLRTFGAIGRHFDNARGALNFSNYLAARGYCHCGAFAFADWENCSCDLKKTTVEFRVFNATANLRKIHAYTALSLALVEVARQEPFKMSELPEFAWSGGIEPHPYLDQTKRALSLIFERLPLTEAERDDLRYCAERSAVSAVFESL
jgi:hypothetical protein